MLSPKTSIALLSALGLALACPRMEGRTSYSNSMGVANRALVRGDNASAEVSFRNALRFAQEDNNLPAVLDSTQRLLVSMFKLGKWRQTSEYFDLIDATLRQLREKKALTDKCLLSIDQLCYSIQARKYWARKQGVNVGSDEEAYCLEQVVRLQSTFMCEHPELAQNIESLNRLYLNQQRHKRSLSLLKRTAHAPSRAFDRAKLDEALAYAYELAGEKEKAALIWEAARSYFEKIQRPCVFWMVKGKNCYAGGQSELALKCYDTAIEAGCRTGPSADLFDAYVEAEIVAGELRQYKKAEGYLLKAGMLKASETPGQKQILYRARASLLKKQGRLQEAKAENVRADAMRKQLRDSERADLKFMIDDMSKKGVPGVLPPNVK